MAIENTELNLPLTDHDLRAMGDDALASVADALGITPETDATATETIRQILHRQALIEPMDAATVAELLRWSGRQVDPGASIYRMAGEASRIRKMSFADLSGAALRALARLRDVDVAPNAERTDVVRALKRAEGFLGKLSRKRRRFVGKLVAKLIGEAGDPPDPEVDGAGGPSIKDKIEEHGLVGGLADRLRGAADDYVALKLDEIEQRIDRKLDDIDRRLAEWRDREIANRLRIIKITLAASVIVALISVVYAWCKAAFDL